MPYCMKCGTPNSEDANFCAKCGAQMARPGFDAEKFSRSVEEGADRFAKKVQEGAERFAETTKMRFEQRFPEETTAQYQRTEGIISSISVGAILIIIALTFITHPIDFTAIGSYFEDMGRLGTFLRPPQVVLDGAIFFFIACGVWSLAETVLRLIAQKSARHAASNLFGGLFCFLIAFLVSAYSAHAVTALNGLAYTVIGGGILVIANGLTYVLFPHKK